MHSFAKRSLSDRARQTARKLAATEVDDRISCFRITPRASEYFKEEVNVMISNANFLLLCLNCSLNLVVS
tara:strand:- start:159 stop:368 length:210 start_codon:yes stop_codon:yes gene_type:complete